MNSLIPYKKILKDEFKDTDEFYRKNIRKIRDGFSLLYKSHYNLPIVMNNNIELEYLPSNKRINLRIKIHNCKYTNVTHRHLTDDIYFTKNFNIFLRYNYKKIMLPININKLIYEFANSKTYCILPLGQTHYYPKINKMETDITNYIENYYFEKYISSKKYKLKPEILEIINNIKNDYIIKKISLTELINKLEDGIY